MAFSRQPHFADRYFHLKYAAILTFASQFTLQATGTHFITRDKILKQVITWSLTILRKQYIEIPAYQFCDCVTKHAFSGGINHFDNALTRVYRHDAISDRIKYLASQCHILAQRLLDCVFSSHVAEHQHGTDHLRIGIAYRRATISDITFHTVA